MNPETPVDIGEDRQLFVDDFWIADLTGVERVLHSPARQDIALEPEHPWEVGGLSYLIAFPDQGKFRGWYRADPQLQDTDYNSITCYAESEDGINWTKPNVGLIEFNGSKDNNIVWTGQGINLAPFKDGNPDAKPEERYKAFIRVRRVMHALSSPDGLRWKMMREEPIHTDYPFDTLNIPLWDTWRKEYVGYFRGVAGQGTSDFFTGSTMDTPGHVEGLSGLE